MQIFAIIKLKVWIITSYLCGNFKICALNHDENLIFYLFYRGVIRCFHLFQVFVSEKYFKNTLNHMKNKSDKIKPRKPNIILLIIRNCAKFLLSEYCFFIKIPEINFKKLSTKDLIVELCKSKPKRKKILYKRHSIIQQLVDNGLNIVYYKGI